MAINRYKVSLPTWSALFNSSLAEGKWAKAVENFNRENAVRAKAQQLLANAFLKTLTGEGEKIRADLEKLTKEQADQLEGKAARRLLKRID